MIMNKLRFQLLRALDVFIARIHWLYSEERHNPYRCPICGGTDVHVKAWIRINQGNQYVVDCDDIENSYCTQCDQTVHIRTAYWYNQNLIIWWSQADFPTMERITGLHRTDFSAQDDYKEFVDACNECWNALPIGHKIKLWNKQR